MVTSKVIWLLFLEFTVGEMGHVEGTGSPKRSKFPPAIYNFGDSNSDTGGRSAALGQVPPPNGETSFWEFKSRTSELYTQLSENRTVPPFKSRLPRPEEFLDALYTFDIGQNDLSYDFQHATVAETQASIPKTLDKFSEAVLQLYKAGARNFWVHNTGPIGCLPFSVFYYRPKFQNLNKNRCVEPQDIVAREFNSQLKQRVFQLRAQLPNTAFTYVDMYSAKYSLISNAKNLGFEDPFTFCVRSYYGANGTVYGNACHNPSKRISWDGIHYSEAANLLLARTILNGTLPLS